MKHLLKYIFAILLVALTSCQKFVNDVDTISERITISLDVEHLDGEQLLSRATPQNSLTQLKVGLYNTDGLLQSNVKIEISKDKSQVIIDELPDNDYTLVFFGVGVVHDTATGQIVIPAKLGDAWFQSTALTSPADNEYFYAKTSLSVKAGIAKSQSVTIKRLSARVDVVPAYGDGSLIEGAFTEAKISFTTGQVYTSVSAFGELMTPSKITNFDVLKQFSFYTLPATSDAKIGGVVMLKGVNNAGKQTELTYTFEVSIEKNKIATIRPKYADSDNAYGTIKLYERDLSRPFVKRIFQDGDSYESIRSHFYKPKEPIKCAIAGNTITITNYLAQTLKDVRMYMAYGENGEFFELAWFEKMNPFEEYVFEYKNIPANKLYRTENGGVVMVEKLMSGNGTRLKYSSSDVESKRLLDAVNEIKWGATIFFTQNDADAVGLKTRAVLLRPVHARLVAAQGVNMGYTMTSDLWMDRMRTTHLYDDAKNKVDFDKQILPVLLNPNSNNGHLYVAVLAPYHPDNNNLLGLSWVGNGTMYLIHQYSMEQQFNGQDVHARVTYYHEYGHVLGYNHNSNLTYGAMHDVTFWAVNKLVELGRMPYCAKPESIGSYDSFYTRPTTRAGELPLYMTNPEL